VAAAAAALVTAVLIIFGPTLDSAFVYYDDDRQILDNPFVKQLSLENVSWILTHFCITSYYPVRLLSFAIDYHFWGVNPRGYHLTNTVVHAGNVLLAFWLLLRLMKRVEKAEPAASEPAAEAAGGAVGRYPAAPAAGSRAAGGWYVLAAATAAGILAVHPVVVEPVVWIPGREELLMTFFALACLHLHISARRAAEHGAGRARVAGLHALAALACVLACLSNVVGAVVPFLVVAYDLAAARIRRLWPVVAGTWFLWAIMAGTIALKMIAETLPAAANPVGPSGRIEVWERAAMALDAFHSNLITLVWPKDLSLQYSRILPDQFFSTGTCLGLAFGLAMPVALWLLRRRRIALFGLLWFLLALGPTSQVIPHHIIRADRFLYLPLVGVTVAAAAGLRWLVDRGRPWRVAAAASVAIVLALGVVSTRYTPLWRDGLTLFRYCLAVTPDNAEAHDGMGVLLAHAGDYRGATDHYRRALVLVPDYVQAHCNLGTSLLRLGESDEAIVHLRRAVELNPVHAESHSNLGVALMRKGYLAEAQQHIEKALQLNPYSAETYDNLGVVLVRQGKYPEARAYHEKALRLNPNDAEAHFNLGTALLYEQKYNEAIAEFQTALALNPAHARAQSNRGVALLRTGRIEEAIGSLEEAVRLDPRFAEAYNNLGFAFSCRGDYRAAIPAFEEALRLNPGYARSLSNLARVLATCPEAGLRNGPRAVQLAEQANQIVQDRDAEYLDVLAAAYAEAGRFDEAVAAVQRAIAVAQATGRAGLVPDMRARLELYQGRKPFHAKP
jgi:tetratricopeptide (TPR) repeat protein